jgi:hypothetical protein
MPLLTENAPNANSERIAVYFEHLLKIRECQDWCLDHLLFDQLETDLYLMRPLELTTLETFCDGNDQGVEIPDESAVEGHQPMETPDVMQGLWLGPLQNCIYLGLICMDTISRYNKTKKSYRSSEERTLLLIDEKGSYARIRYS